MSNNVTRRSAIIGAGAVSAASCTTMPGAIDGGDSSRQASSIDDHFSMIDQHTDFAKLGALVVAYAMNEAHDLRESGKYATTSTHQLSLSLDVVALDDCCSQQNKIAELLIKWLNDMRLSQKKSGQEWQSTDSLLGCNDC